MSLSYNQLGVVAASIPPEGSGGNEVSPSNEQFYFQRAVLNEPRTISYRAYLISDNQRLWCGVASITVASPDFGSVTDLISEMDELSSENEVPPTDYAYLKCRAIAGAAYGLMRPKQSFMTVPNVPKPVIITDDVGGIRLVWRKGLRVVRANFGAAENLRSYVYFESGAEHGVRDLNAASLSERLNWLTKG